MMQMQQMMQTMMLLQQVMQLNQMAGGMPSFPGGNCFGGAPTININVGQMPCPMFPPMY